MYLSSINNKHFRFTVRAGSNPAYKVTECGNVIIRSFRPVGNNQAGQALNELSASLGGAGRVDYHASYKPTITDFLLPIFRLTTLVK